MYILFFALRVLLAIIPQALPYADEMWQGPEIAHNDVFGYGWLTWEWTRDQPLRGPIYHSLFSLLYWILNKLNLDHPQIIAYGPRILQCAISAIYDIYLIKLLTLEGIRNKLYIILVNYTLWFSLNCFSKTLINTFETILFTLALYHWVQYLQTNRNKNNLLCRLLVIVNVMARQSSIIPWIFIWPYHLLTAKTNLKGRFQILVINGITLILLIILSISVDSLYHGKLTSTFYNFLEFNLLSGMSSFYGVHDRLWFITQGLPYVQLGWVISFIIGIYSYIKKGIFSAQPLRLMYYMIFTILMLSLSAHKEDRFLLPLFPIIIYFICLGLEYLDKIKWKKIKKIIILLAVISNISFFILMNTYQDVGALKTMSILRQRNATEVQFFTQCHRTPFYSFIHKNISMTFPDCSPTNDVTSLETYQLHQDSAKYIQQKLQQSKLPSHIVIYNYLMNDNVKKLLDQYDQIESIYHQYYTDTYFEDQKNIYINIYELHQ
ncbi:unnamed protein product [Paramecium primaurelia]|uniref:Mannosyltransferase n=1 Tax=Paramecium primaurelia TaxID=5886 RepID=A0A8S1NNF8_PARPR|nr:unnamed protein product [Paramecium primaurelia]